MWVLLYFVCIQIQVKTLAKMKHLVDVTLITIRYCSLMLDKDKP